MLKPCPSRRYYFFQLLLVAVLLVFAYYLEYYQSQVPCALCELQRLIFASLGVLFLLGSILPIRKGSQLVLNALLALFALSGVIFAARQVWLQHLPVQNLSGSCGGSLHYLLQILPLKDALLTVFLGGPECAKVTWQFLGLSIAGWSFICFAIFLLLAFLQGLAWIFQK